RRARARAQAPARAPPRGLGGGGERDRRARVPARRAARRTGSGEEAGAHAGREPRIRRRVRARGRGPLPERAPGQRHRSVRALPGPDDQPADLEGPARDRLAPSDFGRAEHARRPEPGRRPAIRIPHDRRPRAVTRGRRAPAALILAATLAALGCATGGGSRNVASGDTETYAQQLLRRRCHSCHRVPNPERKSAAGWQKALTRMKRRVNLPPADWDSLATL